MTHPLDYRCKEKAEIFGYARNSINTFVFGPSGIGKTTLIEEIAEDVNDRLGRAVYVDCSLYPTANAVLREILTTIGSVIASKSNYELTKRLKEKTRKTKLIAFIDHFESLKNNDVLTILLGLDFCICLIADSFESQRLMNLNLRVKFANLMKIDKLSDNQVSEILREKARAKTDGLTIQRIVERSAGNLTLALNTLKSIEANPGRSCLEQIDLNDKALVHNEDHSVILNILRQQNRLPSGELYNIYCQKCEFCKSERSFRNFMQTLCKQGLVKSIGDKRGRSYQLVDSKGIVNG